MTGCHWFMAWSATCSFSRVDWEDGVLGGRHVLAPLVSPETGLLRFAPAVQAFS